MTVGFLLDGVASQRTTQVGAEEKTQWPKKAEKIPTDMTEAVIQRLALPLGLVDTKVCAMDPVGPRLRLVITLENRKPSAL
jgi:hypothetical protein